MGRLGGDGFGHRKQYEGCGGPSGVAESARRETSQQIQAAIKDASKILTRCEAEKDVPTIFMTSACSQKEPGSHQDEEVSIGGLAGEDAERSVDEMPSSLLR